jgi:pimeloyl-ACP methyl ester carboxylesterase
LRLDAAGATCRDLDTSLGTTRVMTLGGPDVVLLPGTNFSTATSLKLLALVGREHRAIGVDLPGQPGLSAALRPDDRDSYGVWLGEVVCGLGLERPIVVGHSLSGRAALVIARGDTSIEGLVLVAPAGLIRLRVGPPCSRRRFAGSSAAMRPPRPRYFAGWPAPALIFRMSLQIGLRSWGVTCARASRRRLFPQLRSPRWSAPSGSWPAAMTRSCLPKVSWTP